VKEAANGRSGHPGSTAITNVQRDYRRMKPKQTIFRHRTAIMHPFSSRPLLCAKNFKKGIGLSGFCLKKPIHHPYGIPPAPPRRGAPVA
jgi:hypothetical protein